MLGRDLHRVRPENLAAIMAVTIIASMCVYKNYVVLQSQTDAPCLSLLDGLSPLATAQPGPNDSPHLQRG